MNKAIEYRDIKKTYGDKVIIEGFSMAVEQGEFVTIIGSSGCGKTTILKMANGLWRRQKDRSLSMEGTYGMKI